MSSVVCLNALISIRILQTKQNLFFFLFLFFTCFCMCVSVCVCTYQQYSSQCPNFNFLQSCCRITHAAPSEKMGKITTDHNVSSKLEPDLIPALATPPGSALELHHHDGDVVGAAAVERLEDDALGAEVRLVQALADEPDGLLVAESVPQAVGRQDHELWLKFVQVKGHDVRVGDDDVEVLQRVVSKRAGHGQDPLDPPGAIKTDETSWK